MDAVTGIRQRVVLSNPFNCSIIQGFQKRVTQLEDNNLSDIPQSTISSKKLDTPEGRSFHIRELVQAAKSRLQDIQW